MTPDAIRQRRSRQGRRKPFVIANSIEQISRQPADLTLEDYLATREAKAVAALIREFGEDAALRLLNGRPA